MQVAHTNAKEIQLVATVRKADGTIVELGVIDYWHKNPIKRIIYRCKKQLGEFKKWLHYLLIQVKRSLPII